MEKTGRLYTSGAWTVKPGNEEAFVEAWSALAKWTSEAVPGAGDAHLLQEIDNQRRFLSFGPWDSVETVAAWRQRPEFQAFIAKARALCEDIQPRTLKEVASVVPRA